MNDSETIFIGLFKIVSYLCKYLPVVGYIKVYQLLYSLDILESYAMILIDTMDLRSRDAEFRKLAMKDNSSLLKREVSPIL